MDSKNAKTERNEILNIVRCDNCHKKLLELLQFPDIPAETQRVIVTCQKCQETTLPYTFECKFFIGPATTPDLSEPDEYRLISKIYAHRVENNTHYIEVRDVN